MQAHYNLSSMFSIKNTSSDNGVRKVVGAIGRHQMITRSRATFPFLKLPAELRREICIIRLLSKSEIPIEGDGRIGELEKWAKANTDKNSHRLKLRHDILPQYKSQYESHSPYFNPALILVSHLLHDEGVPILYGMNRFQFHSKHQWKDLFYFQHCLSATGKDYFRNLLMQFPGNYDPIICECGPCESRECVLEALLRASQSWNIHFRTSACFKNSDLHTIFRFWSILMSSKLVVRGYCWDEDEQHGDAQALLSSEMIRDTLQGAPQAIPSMLDKVCKWGWELPGIFAHYEGGHRKLKWRYLRATTVGVKVIANHEIYFRW